jgi:uncharacterized iron-regulated membrane protein
MLRFIFMSSKVFFRRIHLYLAFVAGLVIFVSCLTGTLLVFETELEHVFNKKRYFVKEEKNTAALGIDSLINKFKATKPEAKLTAIKAYKATNRTVEFYFTINTRQNLKEVKPKISEGKKQPQQIAFINPYTSEVIEVVNYRNTFFGKVFWLHRALLANKIGQTITGISTLIFLLILITGIVLWWPKTKAILKQRLLMKKGVGIKRKIFDWHTVLGFYSSIFLFIIACTGLTISFKWFNKMVMSLAGGEPVKQMPKAPTNGLDSIPAYSINYNTLLTNAFNHNVNTESVKLNLPKQKGEAITANAVTKRNAHHNEFDVLSMNAITGTVEKVQLYENKNGAVKLKSLMLPIHKGEIGGMPTRILVFIIALLGATFPVTGFIMWWNRTQKKRKVLSGT